MYAEENPPHHHLQHPPTNPPLFRIYSHRSRGGTGCCCLDFLCNCGCCILSCIFSVIISILVLVGLVILVFWLIVRPHEIKFHVTSASLTQFSLSNTPTSDVLSYNLAVNFSIRNPNRHIGIYYDTIDVHAYYDEQIFATTGLPPFYQGHKNTSDLGPASFMGNNTVSLGSGDVSEFNTERSNGVFKITVSLFLKIRFKLGLFKSGHYKPRIDCDIKVPLDGAAAGGYTFESTRCGYHL